MTGDFSFVFFLFLLRLYNIYLYTKIHRTVLSIHREENNRLIREDCEECKRYLKKIELQDKTIKDKDKYVHLVSSIKDKCVSYLNRALALQDIPDVVNFTFIIHFI